MLNYVPVAHHYDHNRTGRRLVRADTDYSRVEQAIERDRVCDEAASLAMARRVQ